MNQEMMDSVMEDVRDELQAQDDKWGPQYHHPIKWITILTEEVGEAAKEALDCNKENHRPKYYTYEEAEALRKYYMEMIQVVAVGLQAAAFAHAQLDDRRHGV